MPDRPIAPQSREEDTALDRALRPVSLAEFPGQERLKEAAKLGFSVAVVPKANLPRKSDASLAKTLEGMTVHAVERIEEALEIVRGL
jgi:predicted ATP-dependent serine protease